MTGATSMKETAGSPTNAGNAVRNISAGNDPRSRVLAKLIIDQESGCLLWTGYVAPNGYGNTGGRLVHRLMYEWFNGPIPDGLEIDHTCRVKHCAAPAHLEAVTHAENRRRAMDKTHCKRGHKWT